MEDPEKSEIKREEIMALIDEIPDNLLEMTLSYIRYLAIRAKPNDVRDLGDLLGIIEDDFMEEWDKQNHTRCHRDNQ